MRNKLKYCSFAANGLAMISAGLLALNGGVASAQVTQISNEPLITSKGSPIKPNLLLLLDDSGSMADSFLPELASGFTGIRYGYRSRQCNGLAFDADPSVKFNLPVDYMGVEVAAPSQADLFKATQGTANAKQLIGSVAYAGGGTVNIDLNLASSVTGAGTYAIGAPVTIYNQNDPDRWMIGLVTGWTAGSSGKQAQLKVRVDGWSHPGDAITIASGTAWVADNWPQTVHFRYSGTLKPLEFGYKADGSPDTANPLYKACRVNMGAALAADAQGSFSRHHVSIKSSNDDRQKFANWYYYYSTRQTMLRTVVSLAFRTIDDKFRIGAATIRAAEGRETLTSLTSTGRFIHVRDFDAVTKDSRGFTQRQKFYAFVSRLPASGYTPNRGALSFAGRYFGNVTSRQDSDPVQYACQKNFVLLATDGAWNSENESSSFGPLGMAKAGETPAEVGDQDGSAAAPMRDANKQVNLLADVAYYFRNTDIRDDAFGNCTGALGTRVCDSGKSKQDVNGVSQDVTLDPKQTMTTFTMSLGQFGTLKYGANYGAEGDTSDFRGILNGTKNWPSVGSASNDSKSAAAKVDDTWHAAVNGGGRFFNASDPEAVSRGLEQALDTIRSVTGAGSAAATSTLYPVQDNNFFYVASFTAPAWRGDLRAYTIDPVSGALNVKPTKDETEDDGSVWRARTELDATAHSSRRILMRETGTTKLVEFTAAAMKDHSAFKGRCTMEPLLSQCPVLSAEDRVQASDGSNMVNFLRGQSQTFYRDRESKLGDIVSSAPVFDGPNRARYSDEGFAVYAESDVVVGRRGVLYAGGNDGMLHAFDATNGKELWAYVPTDVISQMWRLADRNYGGNHRFFVDGPPVLADVKLSSGWRRILVFGLGAGGRTYIALDVTNNREPKLLWEFKNDNLGVTTARPVVTKVKDGRWVVVLPSGFNNVSPGDGKGRLFVLNAEDGSIYRQIATSVGSTSRPAGLGPVTAWVDDIANNTAKRFYAGDNEGNLWRFDVDGNVEPHGAALRLANFSLDGEAQPITTRPVVTELTKGGFSAPVVYVGTGRMVGTDDLSNTKTQSIYAVRDPLTAEGWSNIRASSVKQTLVETGERRMLDKANPVDWTRDSGWYVDLDLQPKGERINVAMAIQGRTLLAAANRPSPTGSCSQEGGTAWLYALDVETGEVFSETAFIGNSMVSGFSPIRLANGDSRLIVTKSNNTHSSEKTRPNVYSNLVPRRANWRELQDR